MCSTSRDPRWEEHTICTAVAPDAVLTVRRYGTNLACSAVHRGEIARGSADTTQTLAGRFESLNDDRTEAETG
jgi:hypothetical protein